MTTLTVITGTVTIPQAAAVTAYRLQIPFSALDGASFVLSASSVVAAPGDTSGFGVNTIVLGAAITDDAAEIYNGIKALNLKYIAPNGPADVVLRLVFASDAVVQNLTYTEI